MDNGKPLIVMPAYNESASLAKVIDEIAELLPDYSVLVVDDGSTDDTARIAQGRGVQVLQLPFNLGVGGAMRAGFRFAQDRGFTAVIQLDSDGQHNPSYVPELVSGLLTSDIVIGARFAGEGDYKVSGPRRLAMEVLSFSLSRVCKAKLTDTTSGFKAMGPRAIDLFAQTYPAEYLGDTVEALVIASRANLAVHQVPVNMRVRMGGEPSQTALKSMVYLGRAFIALVIGLSKNRKAFRR